MTLVALAKVHAPTVLPRRELPKYAVQVYFKTAKLFWVTKSVILRNPPYTIFTPHPRQAAWRYAFATAAKLWKGAKGTGTLKFDSRSGKHKKGDVVLAVQARAQEVLKELYKRIEANLPERAPTYRPEVGRYYTPRSTHKPEELVRFMGKEAERVKSAIESAVAGLGAA